MQVPDYSKVFTYEVDGLSYTVSLYEQDGEILADIAVLEGSMDVNALYYGDDEFEGSSENLGGALNMNGSKLDGEKVQWDGAVELSDPGIGSEGDDKETYLHEGDTLTVSIDAESLDDIDIVGLRATSTTTDSGSIKAVSDDPEEPVEEDPTYEKVFFGDTFTETGEPLSGAFILDEAPDPNPYDVKSLPEGVEPTFENYLEYYNSDALYGDVTKLTSVVLYDTDEEGNSQELFRFDAPEGGFQSNEEVLDAYYDALEAYEAEQGAEAGTGEDLIAALSLETAPEDDASVEDNVEDEFDII